MIFICDDHSDFLSRRSRKHVFPDDIEGLFINLNLRKVKWLLFGTYHQPSHFVSLQMTQRFMLPTMI